MYKLKDETLIAILSKKGAVEAANKILEMITKSPRPSKKERSEPSPDEIQRIYALIKKHKSSKNVIVKKNATKIIEGQLLGSSQINNPEGVEEEVVSEIVERVPDEVDDEEDSEYDYLIDRERVEQTWESHEEFQGRRTKARKKDKKGRRVISHRANVNKSKDYFSGTEETPVTPISESELISKLREATRNGGRPLKRMAQHILKQTDIELLAGPHEGGLGGGGLEADRRRHITIQVGKQTYHLRMNTEGQIFSITPNAFEEATVRWNKEEETQEPSNNKKDFEQYIDKNYPAKITQYMQKYRVSRTTAYLLVLNNYNRKNGGLKNFLDNDSELKTRMNEVAAQILR